MTESTKTDQEEASLISFATFLESTPPQTFAKVPVTWAVTSNSSYLKMPVIKVYCDHDNCKGYRNYICSASNEEIYYGDSFFYDAHVVYQCGNCRKSRKRYSLHFKGKRKDQTLEAYKYGELPKFGERVPNKLLRYMNDQDKELFFKGISCQNYGHGIAAVAYFRRVVENMKNDIFDKIIEACKTQNADQEIIQELEEAKGQVQFESAVSKIKQALPVGLMIDGHNPIKILHKALSINLHNKSDKECLENATIARKVLTDLAERLHLIKLEDKDMKTALSKLMQETRD